MRLKNLNRIPLVYCFQSVLFFYLGLLRFLPPAFCADDVPSTDLISLDSTFAGLWIFSLLLLLWKLRASMASDTGH